jgi:chitodextrinase
MRRFVSIVGAAALVALGQGFAPAEAAPDHPDAEVAGVAAAFGLTADQARAQLDAQDRAHRLAATLPEGAGRWFDAATGKLTVAVTTSEAADRVRAAGAAAKVVARSKADLDRTGAAVRELVGKGVAGVYGWGVDVRGNEVGVDVDRTKKTAETGSFLSRVEALGVRITETGSSPRQQSGTIQTGNPWWPGSESNCSVGFPVTDSAGAQHFLTAGHCTNDRDQAAYGASGQQNKVGTSNVGGIAGTSATVSGLAQDTAYTFTIKARDAAGNASPASAAVSARTQAGGGGRTLTNDTDYAIRDYQQVFSPIGSTLTGSAATTIGVSLTIRHTCAEDLGITLLDPKGKAYALKYSGGSACTPWSAARTFTVPATASPAAGTWQLRVTDYGPGDTGTLDTWSITL